jgi:hypothetical protein
MKNASYRLTLWLLLFSLLGILAPSASRPDADLAEAEDPPANDAAIIAVEGIDSLFCGPEAPLTLVLKNEGTDTLFSALILYGVTFPFSQLDWEGALPPGAEEELEVLASPLLPGDNLFAAASGLPNGFIDERPSNDGLEVSFQAQPDGQEVRLLLETDAQPQDTRWALEEETGDTLFQSGPYLAADSLYEAQLCLPDGCYSLLLSDSQGDGLAASPNGSLRLLNDRDTILAQLLPAEADFGSEASFSFCLPFECALNAEAEATAASDSNTADGSILLSAANGVPPLMYSIDDGASFQQDALFAGLSPGNYLCRIQDQNQCDTALELGVPACGLELSADIKDASAEADDGEIILSASGNFGPVAYQLNEGAFQDSSSFRGLAPGDYSVRARDSLGCEAQLALTVDLISASRRPLPGPAFHLFPNPADSWVNLSIAPFKTGDAVQVVVRNARGELTQRGQLSPNGYGVEGRISLASLPSGLYWLQLQHPRLSDKLLRVIKR